MFNVKEIRKDFPILQKEMNGYPLVYFDNAGTTLKPIQVVEAVNDYYLNYCANCHSDDFSLGQYAGQKYEEARTKVAKFINAESKEVVFTSGDTASLNLVTYALADLLEAGDEVLLTVAEHASNTLPWYKIAKDKGIVINFIQLDKDGRLTVENVEKAITPKTKVISIAHVTNVLGYVADIKGICQVAHRHNIYVIVDGAQSVPHIKTDVKDLDCDFLCFSGHKMCGPTGIGVLYGKYEHLLKLNPPFTGGGMNARFDVCGNYTLSLPPARFEPGTPNIAGAIGLGAAVDYLTKIGMDNIEKYERELKDYAVKRLLEEVPGVTIYNANNEVGIVTFNLKDIFAQDIGTHFNSYGICVRTGLHCAKTLPELTKTPATVRASLSFYNTFEEVDRFIEVAKKGDEFLDAFFR